MMKPTLLLLGLLASCGAPGSTGPAGECQDPGLLAGCRQLVLVLTPSWESHRGFARCYERAGSGSTWRTWGEPIAVETGRNGLGWGRGLHPSPPAGSPRKREGDGRGPAGAFRIRAAFGTWPPARAAFIRLPYHWRGGGLECVDDPASKRYNRLVTSVSSGPRDWNSSEKMDRPGYDRVYRWGAVIGHNRRKTRPGAGSCIFLHIADGEGDGTAGCTALPAAAMVELLAWLEAGREPVLVQLPRTEYARRWREWGLPAPGGS
jgi:hypothetical protein